MSAVQKPRANWREVLGKGWHGRIEPFRLPDPIDFRRTPAQREVSGSIERGYRSGYLHGYQQAMDDMLSISRLEYSRTKECWNWLTSFVEGPLRAWRKEREHPLELKLPPRPVMPERWSDVRRRIHTRDRHCNECGSTHGLEVDHIVAVSDGGCAEESNLRLLCAICHRDRARRKAC